MSNDQNMEQAILKSATELFLRKGFKATSTTEIAKMAGCNQALVHYYFRTKDRLFEAIFREKLKFFIAALLEAGEEDLPYEERLRKKIESHFDAIRVDPGLPLFFFSEISSNPKRIDAIKATVGDMPSKVLEKMELELQQEITKGRVEPIKAKDLLMTIVSLNIMAFLGEPIFKIMTKMSDEEYEEFLNKRKKENVKIVLSRLKPSGSPA